MLQLSYWLHNQTYLLPIIIEPQLVVNDDWVLTHVHCEMYLYVCAFIMSGIAGL